MANFTLILFLALVTLLRFENSLLRLTQDQGPELDNFVVGEEQFYYQQHRIPLRHTSEEQILRHLAHFEFGGKFPSL